MNFLWEIRRIFNVIKIKERVTHPDVRRQLNTSNANHIRISNTDRYPSWTPQLHLQKNKGIIFFEEFHEQLFFRTLFILKCLLDHSKCMYLSSLFVCVVPSVGAA